jgi:hypothetical protein
MSFKQLLLALTLLGVAVAFTACSFSTDFVVVNESANPIQVRILLKKPQIGPQVDLPDHLGIKSVSELDDDVAWRHLQTSNLTFNADTRTVVVTLMSQEALRVEMEKDASCDDDSPQRLEGFSIEEISLAGSSGAMTLQGVQARRSFVYGAKQRCVLTYH